MHWNLLRIRRAYGTASSVTSLRFNGQIISRQQLSMGRPMFSDTIKLFSITFLRILVSVLLWLPDISCASSLSPSTRETAALSLFDFGFLQDIAAKISTELKNFAPEFCSIAKNLREVLPPVDVVARLVGQLAVALAAYRISTIVAWGVRGYCADNHIDVTTAIFLAELLRYGTLLLASIILFQAFGIQTPQSFTAIVTSLTLAIGLSFQSVLSNFAAGVMLLVFRPYSVGDKVKVGNRIGFVYDISLLATRVDTEDNIRIQVPNSQILNGVVENYTLNPLRRVEVMVSVSPKADIRKTREAIQAAIAPYAYLGTAGSTGPAKGMHQATGTSSIKGAQTAVKVQGAALASQHDAEHPSAIGGAAPASGGSEASWGSKALLRLFRSRNGNLWITPAELMSGLAQQYAQLWKLANGQFRLESADATAKKVPGPEVVLREVTPVGLRWQARVWAPSRRCV